MPEAVCLIREAPHYRREAFEVGLRACGYDVTRSVGGRPRSDGVLVIWNRYAQWDQEAARYEAAGAAVIIAENGIIGATENAHAKQFDPAGDQLYVLSLNFHNGAGRWWIGEPGRWRRQGIEVRPWREDGEHILVLPQRGFGHPAVAPPRGWTERTVAWLEARTYREIRVRPHPGNEPAVKPLRADLDGCWCCVTWGSGAGIKALCAGVPVYSDWPQWLGFPAALPLKQIGLDIMPSDVARETMLDRLGSYQWSVSEIASGAPFRRLMEIHQKRQAA